MLGGQWGTHRALGTLGDTGHRIPGHPLWQNTRTFWLLGRNSPCVKFPSPRPVAPGALMHRASGGTGLREGKWTHGEKRSNEDRAAPAFTAPWAFCWRLTARFLTFLACARVGTSSSPGTGSRSARPRTAAGADLGASAWLMRLLRLANGGGGLPSSSCGFGLPGGLPPPGDAILRCSSAASLDLATGAWGSSTCRMAVWVDCFIPSRPYRPRGARVGPRRRDAALHERDRLVMTVRPVPTRLRPTPNGLASA